MSSRYDPALKSLDLSDFYHDKGRRCKIWFTNLYINLLKSVISADHMAAEKGINPEQ